MRKILFLAILGLAVIGPYLYSKSATLVKEGGGTVSGVLTRLVGGGENGAPMSGAESLLADDPSQALPDGPGLTVVDLLRFDVTPEWVSQHWKQITTGLPGTPLHGMRVALVTGTQPQDVVGTLTYYFNADQKLERIAVYGFCEDPSSLLTLLQQRFALKRDPGLGTDTYVAFYDEQPISFMRVSAQATETDGQTKRRYEIDLELNLPRKGALLSAEKLRALFQGTRGAVT